MSEWALLIALTDEARFALNGRESMEIDCLPFRIGRESRMDFSSGKVQYMERRKGTMLPNNDLYLYDAGERLNISREHLQIDINRGGESIVYDRGSACGTHVDGVAIGGRDSTGTAILSEGSKITLGTHDSPYRFQIKHLDKLKKLERGG